jgi:nitric oxide reductase subunit B
MNKTKKLWLILGSSIFVAFFILGWFGRELYRKIPPIPERVQSLSGEVLMTKDDILRGQQVWQSIGGQQVGSIWGHGAYQAPDWSADWLHRESVALRSLLSIKQYGKRFEDLVRPQQAAVDELLKSEMRANTYDKDTQTVIVSNERAAAIAETAEHYNALFSDNPEMAKLRESYAIHESAIPQDQRRKAIANFFFWTSWAAATQRPDMDVSYTNNWPHEPLVDNALFPLAQKHLPDKKQAELYDGFEKIEVDKIGIGKHDEFHEMLDQLKDTYLKSGELYSESSESACQLA